MDRKERPEHLPRGGGSGGAGLRRADRGATGAACRARWSDPKVEAMPYPRRATRTSGAARTSRASGRETPTSARWPQWWSAHSRFTAWMKPTTSRRPVPRGDISVVLGPRFEEALVHASGVTPGSGASVARSATWPICSASARSLSRTQDCSSMRRRRPGGGEEHVMLEWAKGVRLWQTEG